MVPHFNILKFVSIPSENVLSWTCEYLSLAVQDYAATDEKGERTGVAIKSSKIGKSVGYEALQKKFVKSKQ